MLRGELRRRDSPDADVGPQLLVVLVPARHTQHSVDSGAPLVNVAFGSKFSQHTFRRNSASCGRSIVDEREPSSLGETGSASH
jgi:hypothetical protein